MHIIVSAHSLMRFKERFKHIFPKSFFYDDESTRYLMRGQLSKARHLIAWKMSPFYLNKMGVGFEAYQFSGVIYLCTRDQNCLIIRTVVRTWFGARLG